MTGGYVVSVLAGTGITTATTTGSVTVSAAATGATVTPTTTNATFYVVGTTLTSGTMSTASISQTSPVSYNASTGALSAVSHVSSSDERLKQDIETIQNALEKLEALRGVSYLRNGKFEIGVIAQEVERVVPEVVITDESKYGYKSVSYGNLVGLLIEAVKELSAEVKKLKGE